MRNMLKEKKNLKYKEHQVKKRIAELIYFMKTFYITIILVYLLIYSGMFFPQIIFYSRFCLYHENLFYSSLNDVTSWFV